jgi:hypothetical protein
MQLNPIRLLACPHKSEQNLICAQLHLCCVFRLLACNLHVITAYTCSTSLTYNLPEQFASQCNQMTVKPKWAKIHWSIRQHVVEFCLRKSYLLSHDGRCCHLAICCAESGLAVIPMEVRVLLHRLHCDNNVDNDVRRWHVTFSKPLSRFLINRQSVSGAEDKR